MSGQETPRRAGRAVRFYLESLGCAKNQVDSEQMIAALTAQGYQRVGEPNRAELIVVNSCGFILPAKTESIETTLELRRRHPAARIILAGCLTERYEEDLRRDMPEVDAFAGNRDPAAVAAVARVLLDGPAPKRERARPPRELRRDRGDLLGYPGSAYVKIAEGCDNRCTYCAIPLIRGPLRSRPPHSVVREIRALLGRGIREINLVAQDLGSWGRDLGGPGIADLVERILGIEGEYWLRLLYIHPDHVPPDLLKIPARDRRLLPYFDLPFQHASPRVLRPMGRRGDAATYLDLVHRIRDTVEDSVIRSTFLTGFPGETEEDFGTLAAFQRAAKLDWVGIFPYSREEGTPAVDLPGQVSPSTAERRRRRLERAQVPITERALGRYVGRILPVLLEERIPGERMYLGRCGAQAPEVDGAVVVGIPTSRSLPRAGQMLDVRVTRRNGFDLEGVPA